MTTPKPGQDSQVDLELTRQLSVRNTYGLHHVDATSSANPHRTIAANVSTSLRGSRASKLHPSHLLSANSATNSATTHPLCLCHV